MELEEVSYWFELLRDGEIVAVEKLASLMAETEELKAIFVTIIKNAKEE